MKPWGLVERLKFKFDRASIQKPSHRMKRNLEDESYTYALKNVGKSFWSNILWVKLILCVICSRM